MSKQEKLNTSLKGQEIQKKTIFKPLLANPYTKKNVWPKIEVELQNDLLQSLETNLLYSIKQWNSLSKEKQETSEIGDGDYLNILTGFNSIMETLENQIQLNLNGKEIENSVKVLFVCKNDISSKLLYNHLPTLCALSNVKLITLPKGSSKRLSDALGVSKDTHFLAIKENLINKDKFILTTINSTVDDVKVGYLENIKNKHLDLHVKFVKTEMPIVKKQNIKK